jgi:hypothetical protein
MDGYPDKILKKDNVCIIAKNLMALYLLVLMTEGYKRYQWLRFYKTNTFSVDASIGKVCPLQHWMMSSVQPIDLPVILWILNEGHLILPYLWKYNTIV